MYGPYAMANAWHKWKTVPLFSNFWNQFTVHIVEEVGQNWNFIKMTWFLHHLKAINDRISEWAHFLSLTRGFWRYLNVSASKNGIFSARPKKKKKRFWKGFFFNFLGINTHNFVKNDPKFENKSFFDAECYGGWHEKVFRSQSSKIRGLVSKN